MANESSQSSTVIHAQRVRDPQYREIYANSTTNAIGPFDLTMIFQKASEVAPNQMGLVDFVAVTMSPQHFKSFVRSLNETLTAYEEVFGALTISDADTKPTLNAGEIADRVRAAKEQTRHNPSSVEPKQPARRSRGARRE